MVEEQVSIDPGLEHVIDSDDHPIDFEQNVSNNLDFQLEDDHFSEHPDLNDELPNI